jgi:hypothetical protein
MVWIVGVVGGTLYDIEEVQNEGIVHSHYEQHKSVLSTSSESAKMGSVRTKIFQSQTLTTRRLVEKL